MKFANDPQLAEMYKEAMEDYISKSHAKSSIKQTTRGEVE